jgi:hypothetical protein
MSFEHFLYEWLKKNGFAVSTQVENERTFVTLEDNDDVSPWVETQTFRVESVSHSKLAASDMDMKAKTLCDRLKRQTNGVMQVSSDTVKAGREDSPERWHYVRMLTFRIRRNRPWQM